MEYRIIPMETYPRRAHFAISAQWHSRMPV